MVASRIQSDWSCSRYCTSGAEVRLAAALAATGYFTSVEMENMKLYNLELPSTEDIPSLAEVVRGGVKLSNVTGDLGPLLSSLACPRLGAVHKLLDRQTPRVCISSHLNHVSYPVRRVKQKNHKKTKKRSRNLCAAP